jgi:uncharacterized protein YndB with AHSA1/START domain
MDLGIHHLRLYDAPAGRVFAAWADPAAKARGFSPGGPHELDFRVGGREVAQMNKGVQLSGITDPDGNRITFIGNFRITY